MAALMKKEFLRFFRDPCELFFHLAQLAVVSEHVGNVRLFAAAGYPGEESLHKPPRMALNNFFKEIV